MAKVEFSGFDELELALRGITEGMDALNEELMNDGADYAKQEIERAIYQYGEIRTGTLLRSIRKTKGRGKDGTPYVEVIAKGSNYGPQGVNTTRKKYAGNAYVAFVRNYGRSNSPGSRFWTIAEGRAVKKFEGLLNQKVTMFFKQKGLD